MWNHSLTGTSTDRLLSNGGLKTSMNLCELKIEPLANLFVNNNNDANNNNIGNNNLSNSNRNNNTSSDSKSTKLPVNTNHFYY